MRSIDLDDFLIRPGQKVKLKKWVTRIDPLCESKELYAQELADRVSEMSDLQDLLYAEKRFALLVIFQAMDGAGKDSAIKHVFSGINPQGCDVHSFKQPSSEELEHDFLWRTNQKLPGRGKIGVFNRSYYEEVLVVRVHPEILNAQLLPKQNEKEIWKGRFESIVDTENHLVRNGTRLLKFYLHLSKDEQRKRFLARIDNPEKNWKFGTADCGERKLWDDYMDAYEECLRHTSTDEAPWYAIPADDKKDAHLLISQIIVEELKSLKLSYPKTSSQKVKELQSLRKGLAK